MRPVSEHKSVLKVSHKSSTRSLYRLIDAVSNKMFRRGLLGKLLVPFRYVLLGKEHLSYLQTQQLSVGSQPGC